MTARAQLESDLLFMRRNYANCDGPLAGIIKAAEERLEAMPESKVVEEKRWVSFEHSYGVFRPLVASRFETALPGQWVTFKIEVPE